MLVDSEGKNLSINCLITLHDNAPSLSWIFTKYANEWPPRKKIRKGSTRKKINTKKEQEVVNTKKDPEVVNTKKVTTKKEPEVVNTKKEPEVAHDLWPLTLDLCPLTLTRKRPTLTTIRCHSPDWFEQRELGSEPCCKLFCCTSKMDANPKTRELSIGQITQILSTDKYTHEECSAQL